MKKLNVLTGVLFVLTGLVSLLLSHDLLQAGAWLALGGGLFLSDLHYRPAGADGAYSAATVAISPTRKYLSMGLVLVAIVLFGFLIGRDLKAKLQPAVDQHTTR
ncbi:hypothetical protein [Hymenobacter sp. BT190]|uniref:hypothetical protein n=1 Tax=Hymenobacter sp. BT190 TaxID=2763505 RepID=UPI0016519C88|nr:hypothetical protein [Hymenobacter sp. BT190]MBC6697816.1 hypothetical protein [Hymenobacter sp. BT190]